MTKILTDYKLIAKSNSSRTEDTNLSLINHKDKFSEMSMKYFLSNNALLKPITYHYCLSIQQFLF